MGEKKKFLLRLDPHIYEALERWAADEYRSVNAHVEFMLRDALRRGGRLPRGANQIELSEALTGDNDADKSN
ncbi:MAG: Arc family DNA binding domain-containing protein [Methylocystaceae bacterium]